MELWEVAAVAAAAAAALIVAWVSIWCLQPLARPLKLLDEPKGGRKDHARPTPVTGGVGMIVAFLVVGVLLLPPLTMTKVAFILGSLLLIGVGLLDDRYDLRWHWRIPAQVAAALIMVHLGGVRIEQLGPTFGLDSLLLGHLSVPFTVFATVGLINAVNMIDGADGVAGSLVSAALVMLAAAALYAGNAGVASVALVMAGAVAGFLLHNLALPWRPRARVFMGNAGSAFLGFSVAWIAFRLTQNPGHPVNPVLALWLIPIPVMDCLVLIVRRLRQGRSPFSADRDHIHHLMRDAGFSTAQTVATLVGLSLVAGLVVGQAMRLDIPNPLLLSAFGALCFAWYGLTARRARVLAAFGWLHRRLPFTRPRQPDAEPALSAAEVIGVPEEEPARR